MDLPPTNAPEPTAKEFILGAFVDVSHAACKLTRRSRTGFGVPDSTLKKKTAAVAYNYCREGVSCNE